MNQGGKIETLSPDQLQIHYWSIGVVESGNENGPSIDMVDSDTKLMQKHLALFVTHTPPELPFFLLRYGYTFPNRLTY